MHISFCSLAVTACFLFFTLVSLFYLTVVPLGANFSVHVLLVQRGRDPEAVAHAKSLHSSLRVADLNRPIQDNIPEVQLQTGAQR